MSAVSPQFVQGDPTTTDRNFNNPELQDLYLSTTVDPEEVAFHSSGIRLTPGNDDDRTSTRNVSMSPLDHHTINNTSTPSNIEGYATSYSELCSPDDGSWLSDISGHPSPVNYMHPATTGMWLSNDTPAQNVQTLAQNQVVSHPSSPQGTMDPSQLLTPNLTNNPSPSCSDAASVGSHRVPRSANHPPIPRLITTPLSDSLGPRLAPQSAQAISPVVKVETYSRGDSPERDSFPMNRRLSQSSVHLSPGGLSNGSEEDATSEAEQRTVSRGRNGAWVRNGVTGKSGLAPDARVNAYVPSPNEMEFQRKLEEKNADIFSWSEAVSEANSESGGDDYPPSIRGPSDHHGNRRRAKSTGDHPLTQEDYFNIKFRQHRTDIPGPGVVLREELDSTDDGIEASPSSAPSTSAPESPAVEWNEEKWAQEASEITPPESQQAETAEPSPHQFLGTPPWRDPEQASSSPTRTRIQPVNSHQAMAEYQRRVREVDTISRVATWGTRELDAESIRTFQMMSINPKEKKHERKNSLLKYLPRKQSNLLKRPRPQTGLSTITQPGGETRGGGDGAPAPSRKDSFPHRKLSLTLSPKSPNYSATGGALIAMTRQMAAVGGKESLNVVSPSPTISNPWASFRRVRSRSELPNKGPGLLELMTSHGGPPVPNLNYSAQPEEIEPPAKEEAAEAEEDDEESDEKGLVMEFPIPRDLPQPTLDGFRQQIVQLNPRLETVLVERFAQEQVRRYKRLIEIKQAHAKEVTKGKCKAGKFCFAQDGQAKLLPPRASAQDPDAHTQFHIPGRGGETEESPEILGETNIATAQFPPGVPYPPSQVNVLPAEFECTVCFHVKKFQKPSDWTKHIYEDVQPFTCTFPDCTDPKSFKRKADWVRHESERHRQLEWWECSFTDCRHKCYRKDNFVQHLVREHKLPEPKVKKSKKGSAARGANDEDSKREQEIQQFWKLVESCHHETTTKPSEEPCRFCHNVCTNWKKLTVHLAKHMEQMAIPILGLVEARDFPGSNGGCATENTDTCSGQMSIPPEASDFNPSLSGVADGLGPPLNYITHGQYPSSHAGGSDSLALPYDTSATVAYLPPATSMPMENTAPNTLNDFQSVSPYAPHNAGLSGTSELAGPQPNSVSYPPPFNAGPRPRVSNQDLRVLPEYNNYSMSPTEMQYNPHNEAYVSGVAQNHPYSYHGPMGSAMPYNPGGYHGQGQ
ncbi:hypothetical protein BJY01DRAFT_44632 [Aspergillus pseudoustus]|uniref:C2H2-type domain-containing protein n=1 Tax=Aspergillus pseudoustus TaxID=1810923 RepID=A0ABR4KPV7_9EURO